MPLELYRHALESGQRPDLGINLSVCGSSMIVANTDATQAQTNPEDPWGVLDETDTQHANVRPIAIPNAYLYANIWFVRQAITGTSNVVVRAFGRLPEPVGKERLWPEDFDSTEYDPVGTITSGGDGTGMWVPLYVPDSTTAPIDLNTTLGAIHNTAPDFSISFPAFVYLQGCTQMLVTVETASTQEGLICVNFHG